MPPFPDSTRLKPLLLLSMSGPLLMLILLTQLDARAMRQQMERAASRRLRAVAQAVAQADAFDPGAVGDSGSSAVSSPDELPSGDPPGALPGVSQPGVSPSDAASGDAVSSDAVSGAAASGGALSPGRLTGLAESLAIRLQIVELTEPPQLRFDSHRAGAAGGRTGSQKRSDEDGFSVDGESRELFLARASGSGEDRRRINGVWYSFAAVRLPSDDGVPRVLRVSAPTYSGGGGSLSDTVIAWLAVVVLTGALVAGAVLLHRRTQSSLERLSATHRGIRRLAERDDSLPGVEARLPVLVDAYAEAARRLDLLVSGHRSRITELEQATGFLETVLEAMVEGVLVVDRDHRVAFANQTAVALLGADTSPAGRPVLEIVRHPVVDQTLRQIDSGHDQLQTEFELRGEQRILSLFATRLRGDASGGAMLVLQDVTDLRRLETLRRDFVSNVSHELKTPLAGIQAFAETLLEGAMEDAAASRRFVTRIHEQSERLNELVHDLLQLGRIEAGQEAFRLERVSVAEAILAAVESQQAVAAGRQVAIELRSPSADLFVTADQAGLQTIFDNLISNAVKYTPESGRVLIHWSRQGDEVRIDVVDSGVGIPSEHLPRIFERFYRVDEARSRDIGGTGLGLSIVKHLASEFGGSVEVQSEPGQGSTFTVRLPAA